MSLATWVDVDTYSIDDITVRRTCAATLDDRGALVLPGFFRQALIDAVLAEVDGREHEAFYTSSTHNVWLNDGDPSLPGDHVYNQQIESSKGLLADDQLPVDSPLRSVYDDDRFRSFVAAVVGLPAVYPYADPLSSVNVHLHADGQELG